MVSLDRATIEGRLDIIERNLRFLEEYRQLGETEFLESYMNIQAAKHSVLEIIEACIDIANHIISVKGFSRAESYGQMFEVLGKEGVLEEGLAGRLREMAKFRNLLVHRYVEVDNARVLEIIKHQLDDAREFERGIQKLIE